MIARDLVPLAVFLALAAAGEALADDKRPPAAAGADVAAADSFCPTCRRPVSWETERCAGCGTEFEPLRPRVKKGEGKASPPGGAKEGANESPFSAPKQGEPSDKQAPSESIIDSPWRQIQPPEQSKFGFGSYGRVGLDLGTDLNGAKPLDLVDFRPRLGKAPYEELHFFYKDKLDELPVLVKSTLAFDQKLFHYDGDFAARMALRELYCEVEPTSDLAVWIGARMYRGEQIYLFDFWPLDEQNTLGGGAALRFLDHHKLQVHFGANRIVDKDTVFYFQEVTLPRDDQPGSRDAVFLDRNRGVASLTYALELPVGFKLKVHGEGHYLPPGTRRLEPSGVPEHLPADHGFLVGTQIGGFMDNGTHGNLFVKYAKGLGAYDELQMPFGFDTDLTITEAERLLVGIGGALETPWAGAHYGFYWQKFTDANGVDDRNDNEQFALGVRPLAYIGKYFRAGFELTWQGLQSKEVFVETGNEEFQQVSKFSLLAGIGPKPGVFARPELLVFYSFKWLNQAAAFELGRKTLAETPDREEQSFGLLAEWWF